MALPRGAMGLSAVCKCGIVYVLDDLRKCMRLLYKHEHIIEDIFFFSIFFWSKILSYLVPCPDNTSAGNSKKMCTYFQII